jgi:hypothetical protein
MERPPQDVQTGRNQHERLKIAEAVGRIIPILAKVYAQNVMLGCNCPPAKIHEVEVVCIDIKSELFL